MVAQPLVMTISALAICLCGLPQHRHQHAVSALTVAQPGHKLHAQHHRTEIVLMDPVMIMQMASTKVTLAKMDRTPMTKWDVVVASSEWLWHLEVLLYNSLSAPPEPR